MPKINDDRNPVTPLKKFRKTFLRMEKPTVDEPNMPSSLSKLQGDKLSDLMNLYTAWREFTEDLMIDALAEHTQQRMAYDYEYDVKMLDLNGTKYKVREKEAVLSTDKDLRKLYVSLSEAELYETLLSKKLESYNNCLTVISREITRRGIFTK